MRKKEEGITLIALVITIIVMLIIVLVTVNFAINGGLFSNAKKASDDYSVAQEKEKISVALATWNGIKYSIQEKTFIECLTDELLDANVEQIDEDGIQVRVTFRDTGHKYLVSDDGEIIIDELNGQTSQVEEQNQTIIANREDVDFGSFVQYDVSYDDMYIDQSYTNLNGWRIVDYTYDENNEVYNNVKLISTGVPVILYFHYDKTANNNWWETDTTKLSQYKDTLSTTNANGGTYSYPSNSYYSNIKFALGLYQDSTFKNIQYKYGTHSTTDLKAASGLWGTTENNYSNKGYFKSITVGSGNNAQTYNSETTEVVNGSDLFILDDEVVRILTLPEINNIVGRNDNDSIAQLTSTDEATLGTKAKGLFVLNELSNLENMSNYSYSNASCTRYWVASPEPGSNSQYSVIHVIGYGGITGAGWSGHWLGLRPTIILGDGIVFTDNDNDGVLEYKK